jgi:predicted ATPase
MLTRIEIDGFRTFEDFALDLEPFLVVLGANTTGKSNLLEAIGLLGALATGDLVSSFRHLRGGTAEAFRWGPNEEPSRTLTLAAEVLLSPTVRVGGGRPLPVPHTRIRYEVEIERGLDGESVGLLREEVRPIRPETDRWANRPNVSAAFRSLPLRYQREVPWLPADPSGGNGVVAGRIPGVSPDRLTTALSAMTEAADMELLALREEMRSWRLLHLELPALRAPTPPGAPQELGPDGSGLPGYLAGVLARTRTPDLPQGVLGQINMLAESLAPGTPALDVVQSEDGSNCLTFQGPGGRMLGPTSFSDGSLRAVALATILCDPTQKGMLCIDEVENGLTPAHQALLVERALGAVSSMPGLQSPAGPLFQLLLVGRSPALLQGLGEEDLAVFAQTVKRCDPHRRQSRNCTQMRRLRCGAFLPADRGIRVTRGEIANQLALVPMGDAGVA